MREPEDRMPPRAIIVPQPRLTVRREPALPFGFNQAQVYRPPERRVRSDEEDS